jgi:hypothetical protein
MKCLKCGQEFDAMGREPLCQACVKLCKKPRLSIERKGAYLMLGWLAITIIIIEIGLHMQQSMGSI